MLFLLLVAVSAQEKTGVYKLDSGPIRGRVEDGINVFRGVPYAAPPVGNLRLKSPQPVTPWTETMECYLPSPTCPQFDVTTDIYMGKEDCLYVDLYVPATKSSTPRPVYFWIYGGGYVIGSGYQEGKYDGKNISRTHDYIVVAFNYRLGALGFLSLDQLKAEDVNGSTGNYALQDQVAALQWVQRNIHVFGGDPTKVTIAGESAGAFSVCWHLVSPVSRGMFRAAVMESGTCDSTIFFLSYDRAKSWSSLHTKSVGCDPDSPDVTTCLRALDAGVINRVSKELYKEQGYWLPLLYPLMPWGPVIDGSPKGLLDLPLTLLQTGKGNYVPHIAGVNHNEGSIFVPPARIIDPNVSQPLTEDGLEELLGHFFCYNETMIDQIVAEYPLDGYKNVDHQASMILRDYFFVCPTKRFLAAESTFNPSYPYMYQFTYTMHYPIDPVFGDYHSSELNYVFDNPWPAGIREWTTDDQTMARTFGNYWSNLVYNLTANGQESVPMVWPNYNATTQYNIVMDVPTSLESQWVATQCQMWDQVQQECQYCGC